MNFEKILKDIKGSYLCLRLKEVKHRFTYKKKYSKMAHALERFKKCDNKKPSSQIRKEINLCKQYWGCFPLHYYRYNLYRNDKELSERELLNYIPEFFFYDLFLPFYDSGKYEILLTDKIITEQLFRSLSIPQAHTICKVINNHIFSIELGEIKFNAIKQELKEKKYQKIFVKPVDGQGGYGIFIFERNNRGVYRTANNDVLNEEFLHEIGVNNNYIIQAGLEQIKEISYMYPRSVNTFRIATENKNGNTRVLCSTLRMGKGGNQVDNSAQDGIVLGININTGETDPFAATELGVFFSKHPDTNFVFKNHKISNWRKVKDAVLVFAKKLPQFVYLGWDIALTQNGPIVIETNLGFGLDHYQVPLGGLREIFNIDVPQIYWRKERKK